jgi:putative bacteriocin precursor
MKNLGKRRMSKRMSVEAYACSCTCVCAQPCSGGAPNVQVNNTVNAGTYNGVYYPSLYRSITIIRDSL